MSGGGPAPARVLVAEPLSDAGLAALGRAGFVVETGSDWTRETLLSRIAEFDALVVRSATKVDRELLSAGSRLRVVGRAGVGLDNVDVKAATALGVLVVNAPSGNVVSAAEHSIALLLALLRRIPDAQASLKAGEWKRAKFVGTELQGKTVGLVGLGQVGARVAARLRPWQVTLLAHDPFVTPSRASELGVTVVGLDELLERSDVVSLHAPSTPETVGLISAARLARMKDGALLVNCARGALVDEPALLAALESGKLGGAALDVFSVEPPKEFALAKHPKVVATPHLGASTVEAQERVALETVEMVVEALKGSPFVAAVNLPFPPGGDPHVALPWMKLAASVGELASQLASGAVQSVAVTLTGVPAAVQKACAVSALKGVLMPSCAEGVNLVNAATVASQRGISVTETVRAETGGYANLVTVSVTTEAGARRASGTLFGERHGRVVTVDGLPMEFVPEGTLLFIENRDVPGVVGRIGTLLGEKGVNIADFALARGASGRAAAVVKVDRSEGTPPDADLASAVAALPGIDSARLVTLS